MPPASNDERAKAIGELAALQPPNGGWAQLPHMQPDAYSTGEALVALHDAGGIATSDPRWQKGLRYLLSTQDDQGVWHVHTRMISPGRTIGFRALASSLILRTSTPWSPATLFRLKSFVTILQL